MNFKNIKICSKTVMDTTDPNISFNEKGESNYYTNYLQNILPSWKNNGSKFNELLKIADQIKKNGKNQEFDCIIGASGGVDSSFLAMKCKEWGLNILLVHLDNGWNTNESVRNIKSIQKITNFDLLTPVNINGIFLSFFK